MFETAVVRASVGQRRFGLLSFSVVLHTAVVLAVLAASLTSAKFPTQAPKQMLAFISAIPITLPPALGTSGPKPQQSVAPKVKAPVTAPVAPRVIPDAIVPLTTQPSTVSLPERNDDIGVPWGKKDATGPDGPPSIATSSDDGPLLVGGEVKAPVVIRRVDPLYPRAALQARLAGWVVLRCIIDKTGHIRDVQVVTSSFGAFTQPAVDAVQQWFFAPGTLNGKPVDVIFELTVRFQVR
jgi:TonB family protein